MNQTQNEFNTSKLNQTIRKVKPLMQLSTPAQASLIIKALMINKKGQSLTNKNNEKSVNSPNTENIFLEIKQIPIHIQTEKHKPFISPSNHSLLDASKQNPQFKRAKISQFPRNVNVNTISQEFTNKESVGSSTNITLLKDNDVINSIREVNSIILETGVHQSSKNILKVSKSSKSSDRHNLKLTLEGIFAQKKVQDEGFSKDLNRIQLGSNESITEIIEDLTKNDIIKINQLKDSHNIHFNNKNKDIIKHLQSFTFPTTRPLSGVSTKNTFISSRFNFFPADRSIFNVSTSISRPLTSLLPKRKIASQKVHFLDNSTSKNNSKLLFESSSMIDLKNKFERPFSAINLKRYPNSILKESKPLIVTEPDLEYSPSPKKEEVSISLEKKIKIMNKRYQELNLNLDPIIAKTIEEEQNYSRAKFFEGTLDNCNQILVCVY